MNKNRVKRNCLLGERMVEAINSRNMEGYFAESREEALKKALALMPEGSSVGWGGSVSVAQIGLKDAVIQGNYQVYNREAAKDAEEKRRMELAAFGADYFLASANAISEDGIIVNIDGYGNRVAAIISGPRNVILIVGMNKVTKDVESAFSRARNEAAPINAQRFGLDTPCAKTGACFDCKSPDTICCQMVITRFSRIKGRIKVILVNDVLGF